MAHGVGSLVKGESEGKRCAVLTAHVTGGLAGGALAGTMIWLALTPPRTFLPRSVTTGLAFAFASWAVAVDLHLFRFELPGRQVPATWLRRYGPTRSYAAYGALLGSGLLTNINYAVVPVVFAASGLLLPLLGATAAGAGFGLARALAVCPASLRIRLTDRILYQSTFAAYAWPRVAALVSASFAVLIAVDPANAWR